MIEKPMDVLRQFPVRKSKKQKQPFRDEIRSYVKTLGYESSVEKGSFGSRNVVIGDPETAEYLVTAHYDTPAGMPFPNLITPCNFWPFLAYQLLITALILFAAMIPGLVLISIGVDSGTATFVWLVGLYVLLGLMMFGPANKSNANDNTSGVVTVLEAVKNLPEEYRSKVCFILFDLEEAGLIGSSSYQGKHKGQTKNQIVLNCDCVGDGDELMMFPTRKVKKDANRMDALRSICGTEGEKSLALREKGFAYYPSDQANFPYGVGIGAFRRSEWAGLYCGRIHTGRDTVLEEENVNYLCRCLIQLITGTAE